MQKKPKNPLSQEDVLVRSGRPLGADGRHVNFPIEFGSTIVFDTLAAFEKARDSRFTTGVMYYGRYGNAASFELEAMLAELEEAEGVTLTSSGVAAISMVLTTYIYPGCHLLVADHVYGNTRAFCENVLKGQGVNVEYFDPMIGSDISKLITDKTCAIMFEAPGSGTFEMPDIRAIAEVGRNNKVPTILDGTWSSPIFCQQLSLGIDVLVYSGSKYICGHSDCMMGVVACSSALNHERIRKTVMAYGDKTGSQEVYLALRGLRTLKLRMEAVDTAAREIASFLQDQPQTKILLHPAFESCPGHEFWKRDFSGAAGLFSVIFNPCSDDQIRRFVDSLEYFHIGVSWGGFESLVLPVKPVRDASPWNEAGQLVRFNVGLENIESLKADLVKALPILNS